MASNAAHNRAPASGARIHSIQDGRTVTDFPALRRAVRHDVALSPQARLLFEDLCDLSMRDGYSRAGDKHFATTYDCDRRTVRRWMNELREAGYLTVEGATRNRRVVPVNPGANPETGDELRTQGDLGHRTPGDLKDADLGHSGPADLGHSTDDTKSIPSSEGESGAREPFDGADEYRRAFPDASLNWYQEDQLRQKCTDPDAFGKALHIWLGADNQSRNVVGFVDRYRRIAAGEAGADGRFASRPGAAAPSLNGDLSPEEMAWHVANTAGLSESHFYRSGTDGKSGLATYRIKPTAKPTAP